MFSQLTPINENSSTDLPFMTNDGSNHSESANNITVNNSCCSALQRLLHLSALTLLSLAAGLLFVQLQALSLRVSSQQYQIDQLKKQLESSTSKIQTEVDNQHNLTILHIAGTFTLISSLVTMFHMTSHLRKMNQPFVQRKIVAILWMSPIYGITSFLSLILPSSAEGYLGIVKDFYESYVIYQFLSFLIAVLGRGNRDMVVQILVKNIDHLDRPYRWLGCMFHPSPEESEEAMAQAVLIECQVLAMQFVFFRPVISIANFIVELLGHGDDNAESQGNWTFFYSPKFFLLMVQNLSVYLAFSGLLKFYHAVRDELAWCQPFNKFLTIKGVVFMTFWQGLIISILFHVNKPNDSVSINDGDSTTDFGTEITSASTIQHILICMEMLLFSVAHWCVFPAEEWEDGYKNKFYQGPGFAFQDFASDMSFIIDSSKKSLRARKEKKNLNGLEDESTTTCLSNDGRESPSFGSMDDAHV